MNKQREIKIRAWDKIAKRFIPCHAGLFVEVLEEGGFKFPIYTKDSDENIILTQYTGLKDKDGNEIYEGDVVEGLSLRNFKVKEVVNWDKFQWFPFAGHWGLRDFEVIGNIYSNPELTK